MIQVALSADLSYLGASAAGLGVVLHLSIFRTRFPVEDYLGWLLAIYLVAILATLFVYTAVTPLPPLQILARVGCIVSAFNGGLLGSIIVYRLLFHRLRRFPGAPWSKLTRFYDAYLAGKDVQYNVEIQKLHDKYGDFIRTGKMFALVSYSVERRLISKGPREVCIVRKSAVPLIYGPQSRCLKSTYYAQASTNPKYCSVHHTRDFDDHRKRRKAWDRGFSMRGGCLPWQLRGRLLTKNCHV